jgi:hypothetical protein
MKSEQLQMGMICGFPETDPVDLPRPLGRLNARSAEVADLSVADYSWFKRRSMKSGDARSDTGAGPPPANGPLQEGNSPPEPAELLLVMDYPGKIRRRWRSGSSTRLWRRRSSTP